MTEEEKKKQTSKRPRVVSAMPASPATAERAEIFSLAPTHGLLKKSATSGLALKAPATFSRSALTPA